MSKSLYSLIEVVELEDGTAQLENVKNVIDIYDELVASNVTSLLSFHGGIRLSNILNKLQQAIADQGGISEDLEDSFDDVLSEDDRSYLYGVYLLSN